MRDRLTQEYEITAYDSDVLVNQGRDLVDYFVAVAKGAGDGKAAANWIQQSVLRTLNEDQITIDQFPVSAEGLAGLIQVVLAGKMETSRGREVLAKMMETGATVEDAMKALGIAEVDESDLEALCAELIAANPKVVEDVKQGKLKAAGSLIGQGQEEEPQRQCLAGS